MIEIPMQKFLIIVKTSFENKRIFVTHDETKKSVMLRIDYNNQ